MSNDTKPDSEAVEKFRELLMKHHSDDMTMEQVSSLAHEAARTEQFARKIANCMNDSCTTCPANALQIAYYVQERETAALEIFIPTPHPSYEVSNTGKVRNAKTGRILKPAIVAGYPRVSLGSGNNVHIHRLVAIAFLANPYDKPCVNHIDGDKTNNKVGNLEWVTYAENEQHSFKVLGKQTHNKGKGRSVIMPCQFCGKHFKAFEWERRSFCSVSCASKDRYYKGQSGLSHTTKGGQDNENT